MINAIYSDLKGPMNDSQQFRINSYMYINQDKKIKDGD